MKLRSFFDGSQEPQTIVLLDESTVEQAYNNWFDVHKGTYMHAPSYQMFWSFVGGPLSPAYHSNTDYVEVTEDVAERIKKLAGPHARTLILVEYARRLTHDEQA